MRTRFPSSRNHPSPKRSSIQRPLRPQMLLAPVISHQIPDKRMLRPRPKPAAFALVIAHFISQLRIAKSRQTIRRNKLAFPRRKPLPIPSPPSLPLVRRPPCLVDRSRKHPLHISFRSKKRLPQINHFPLFSRRSNQRPVPAHILSRDPSRLPVPRPQQLPLSFAPHKLRRISTLLFLLAGSRRFRKLSPRRLSGTRSRTLHRRLRRLTPLRPSSAYRHQHVHQQMPGLTLCPPCPLC